MPTDTPDIVVLDDPAHGIPATEYVESLRTRLPEHEVTLATTPEAERTLLSNATVATGRLIDEEAVERAENLRLFACTTAGVNHLSLEAFERRGVAVTNASGVHASNIAEHVLGWMLMFTRRLDEGLRRQGRREWRRFQSFTELTDSTVTIVGLGAIGTAIARRVEGFDARTVGVRYTPSKGGPVDRVIGYDDEDLYDALSRTDFLVLACPLTEETEGLVDEAKLGALPSDAVVVNIARGKVLDTEALVDALRKNQLHGAALDVTDPEPLPADHPLWSFENVFLTPHVSGHTPIYWERVADILAENLESVSETGEYRGLRNQVV